MEKGTALLRLLRDIAALGRRRTPSLATSERVLWFADVPAGRPECRSPFLAEGGGDNSFWLEARKTPPPGRPAVPVVIADWLHPDALDRPDHEPQLLQEINVLVEPRHGEASATQGDGRPGSSEMVPERRLLREHPEVEYAWLTYFVENWEPWAAAMIRWQATHQVYEDIDFMRRRIEESEERFELRLGLGLAQWRDPSGTTVKRHLLTASAEIELDAARGILTVVPAADFESFKIELDMLELHDQPRFDEAVINERLEELDMRGWNVEVVGTILRELANRTQPGARVDERAMRPLASADETLWVQFAPALVLRERKPTAFSDVIARLLGHLEDESSPSGTTAPWEAFLAEGEPAQRNDADAQNHEIGVPVGSDGRILFPLPTNDEQRQIIDRLRLRPSVVVKGPPGTGKSLTIANLICHLLAQGDRILVTAQAPKALDVLRELLPEDIRALCVTSLGASRDDQRVLEDGVRGILRRRNEWAGAEGSNLRVASLEEDLSRLEQSRAEIGKRLRETREAETYPHVLVGGYEGTAAQIARLVERDKEDFGWFPPLEAPEVVNPLSASESDALAEAHSRRSGEYLREVGLELGADLLLPDVPEFRGIVESLSAAEMAAQNASRLAEHVVSTELGTLVSAATTDALVRTALALEALEVTATRAERVLHRGAEELLRDVLSGRTQHWVQTSTQARTLLKVAEEASAALASARVEVPVELEGPSLLADAQRRLAHFEEGGSRGFWFLAPRVIQETRQVEKLCLVDGTRPASTAQLVQLVAFLRLRMVRVDLATLWPTVFAEWRIEPTALTEPLREAVSELEGLLVPFLAPPLDVLPVIPTGARASLAESTARGSWRLAVQAEIGRRGAQAARGELGKLLEQLRRVQATGNAHSLLSDLVAAIDARDVVAWGAGLKRRSELLDAEEQQRSYLAMVSKLRVAAPALVLAVEEGEGDATWSSRLKDLGSAWHWAAAVAWLCRVADVAGNRNLVRDDHRRVRDAEAKVEELASARAWNAFLGRLDEVTVQNLNAWTRALSRVGKDTGRFAYRHRRTARRYLMECVPKIPAWVMPLHRVWETIDARPGLFDTVIIDEASQSSMHSLALLLLAKRIIVVGDEKQNTPEAVGILEDDIARLVHTHLSAFRFRDEFRPDTSLFDHAERAFGNLVTLREHFRCVPEIIRFSNELCYQDAPLIPLRQAPPNRLPPLRAQNVPNGACEGDGARIVNRAEAEALVGAVVRCVNDDAYDGKSMGVIALQGQAQAKLIERLLAEKLSPLVIKERKLRCGESATFQGDQRHVVFLSLVMSAERRSRALTGLPDQRRFNVAMSRACDQVWLFHSVQQHDLSPQCLRRRLLAFFQNPRRDVAERLAEERDRLAREACRTPRTMGGQPAPFESWFELDVALELLNRGYRVRPQFEMAGRRIDLVIEGREGRLAIECDGDTWHGPERFEHDMARQRQLERAGLTFVRIRESEYYANRARSVEEVLNACRDLGIRSAMEAEEPAGEADEAADNGDADAAKQDVDEGTSEGAEAEDGDDYPQEGAEVEGNASAGGGPFSGYSTVLGYPDPRTASPHNIKGALRQILERDAPLARASLYRLYIEGTPDVQRAGKAVRQAINQALGAMLRADEVVQENEFGDSSSDGLVVRLTGTAPVRERPAGARDLTDIPPSELLLVLERISPQHAGERDEEVVCRRLLDHYGYTRLTAARRKHLRRVLRLLGARGD
jgi:very-short-patch-repair endonuclease